VKVFDGKTGAEIQSFLATGPAFTGGVYVAVTGGSISPTTALPTLIVDVRTGFPEAANLLASAKAMLDGGNTISACHKIGAFILQVNAQSGKGLTIEQAEAWIKIATDIRVALGCR